MEHLMQQKIPQTNLVEMTLLACSTSLISPEILSLLKNRVINKLIPVSAIGIHIKII